MLSVVSILPASAIMFNGNTNPEDSSSVGAPDDDYYISPSDVSAMPTENYFIFQWYEIQEGKYPQAFTAVFNLGNGLKFSLNELDDRCEIRLNSSSGYRFFYNGHYGKYTDGSNSYFGFNYYYESKVLRVYTSKDCSSFYNLGSELGTHNVETDLFDIPNGLNIDVSFAPVLEGGVNLYDVSNGAKTISDYFTLTINNKTKDNYQYCFGIVSQGFEPATITWDMFDSHFKFLWCEKTYDGYYGDVNLTVNSVWHYLYSRKEQSHSFSWSQMSLKAGMIYDAVVWVVPNDTLLCSSDPVLFEDGKAVEIYRSSFHLPIDTEFDPTNSSFGNIPNRGLIDYDSIFGFTDSDGTHYMSSNKSYGTKSADLNKILSGYSQYISGFNGGGSSFDSDIINSDSIYTSFFDFLSKAFSFLPTPFITIFSFGFISIIIVGIVKAVIK